MNLVTLQLKHSEPESLLWRLSLINEAIFSAFKVYANSGVNYLSFRGVSRSVEVPKDRLFA